MAKPPAGIARWASTYPTASELLGREIGIADRRALWAAVPVEQALSLIANMLKDHDLSNVRGNADAGWAREVVDPTLKTALLKSVLKGQRLIAPQILLLAALEALEHCPPGPPANDLSGLDDVFFSILGLADEVTAPAPTGQEWASLDQALSAELVANGHFNHTADAAHLLAWTDSFWHSDWPASVDAASAERVAGQPGELFEEATGVRVEKFIAVAIHLWTQAGMNHHIRFPSKFFDELGLDRGAVDLFLHATTIDIDDLRSEVRSEQSRTGSSNWAFNSLRRYPLVRLNDGSWLVFRLGFLVERALSDTTFLDVQSYLKEYDKSNGTNRDQSFRQCVASAFEAHVEAALRRMFPPVQGHSRVYNERQMQAAWHTRKRHPKICDFAVDCGYTWLLFDVTYRRIKESVVNGTASAKELDAELDAALTKRKAEQFASTENLLRENRRGLTNRDALPGTRCVPIVITPDGGLGWTPPVAIRAREIVNKSGVVDPKYLYELAIMSARDLSVLEAALEQGQAAHHLLETWRTSDPDLAFDQFLDGYPGVSLRRPAWENQVFSRVMDSIVAQAETAEAGEQPPTQ